MLDVGLARPYNVETKRPIEAVKPNMVDDVLYA
jgi:hypothetical protein